MPDDMTPDELIQLVLDKLAEEDGRHDPRLIYPLDLMALYNDEMQEQWLVDGLWPTGRSIHIHAARKTGKSLVSMWMACCLAMGIDPLTRREREPVVVAYLDLEMTALDVKRRMFDDMEFEPSKLIPNLHYYMSPPFPALDTWEGGERLLFNMRQHGEKALIIDTFSRVISGEENSNDTYIKFNRYTGTLLKSDGISMARNDHEGHEAGRSRGASAKGDDVDIVWQLAAMDGGGLVFNRKASRVPDVAEHIYLERTDEPLAYRRAKHKTWIAGTAEKAAEMDELEVPTDATQRECKVIFKAHGRPAGKTNVLQAALNYRRERMLWED
jgi:RecA-family ATPase